MHLEIWVDGEYCDTAVLVVVVEGENYLEDGWVEPVELETVEAALNYVKEAFPNGWRVVDGRVVPGTYTEGKPPDSKRDDENAKSD